MRGALWVTDCEVHWLALDVKGLHGALLPTACGVHCGALQGACVAVAGVNCVCDA